MRRRAWSSDPWCVLVVTLAAHRITRLITSDELPEAETARVWLEQRLPERYRHGVRCPWCMSWWVALAAVAAAEAADRTWPRRTWLLAAAPWAVASVVGQIAEREPA